MSYKLIVKFFERGEDGDLVQSLKRQFPLIVDGKDDILSLKHHAEVQYRRIIKCDLHILELLDGDDCNIEWDAGHSVQDYFTRPAEANGAQNLYTLKVVRSLDQEEAARREREGTVTGGGSIDFSHARSIAVQPAAGAKGVSRLLNGARDPDAALPSNECDTTDTGIVPATPVSRKRRRSSNQQFRPAPASRNSSLQFIQSRHNDPTNTHTHSSAIKPESPSENSQELDDKPHSVVQVQNSYNNDEDEDITMGDGEDEALLPRPTSSSGKLANGVTRSNRDASKEALGRTSKAKSPRHPVWDPSSQEIPSTQPKRPTALANGSVKSAKTKSGRMVNGATKSSTAVVMSLSSDGDDENEMPTTSGNTTEQISQRSNGSLENSSSNHTHLTNVHVDENHGDFIQGSVTPDELEDAMNIDVPTDSVTDFVKPAGKPAARGRFTKQPSTTPATQSSSTTTSDSSLKTALRKSSMGSDARASAETVDRSSPTNTRRSVGFSDEVPSNQAVRKGTKKSSRAKASLIDDEASASGSDEDEEGGAEEDADESVEEDDDETPKASKTKATAMKAPRFTGTKKSAQDDSSSLPQEQVASAQKSTRRSASQITVATPDPQPAKRVSREKSTPAIATPIATKSATETPKTDWAAWRANQLLNTTPAPAVATPPVKQAEQTTSTRKAEKTPAVTKAPKTPAAKGTAKPPTATKSAKKTPAQAKPPKQGLPKSVPKVAPISETTGKTKPTVVPTITQSDETNVVVANVQTQTAGATPQSLKAKDRMQPRASESDDKASPTKPGLDKRKGSIEVEKPPTRAVKMTRQLSDIDKVKEMRRRATDSPASSAVASPFTEPAPISSKKTRLPPGKRNLNAPVVAGVAGKKSQATNKAVSPEAPSPRRTDEQKVDAMSPPIKIKLERQGSDAGKIAELPRHSDKQKAADDAIEITSGEDSDTSSDSDGESEIPGTRPQARSESLAKSDPELSSDSESDAESGEEDSQEAESDEDANDTLIRSLNVPKSSQSLSLTPPKDEPNDVDMPDAPSTQGATRTRSSRKTPAALQLSEDDDTPPASQVNRTRGGSSAARRSSRRMGSPSDDDERPRPSLLAQSIPTQPQPPETSESDSESENQPPVSTQTRVTTQLNLESAAAREQPKSSQFDASSTPTPAGRELRPGAARGAVKAEPLVTKSQTTARGLSTLRRQQAEKASSQHATSRQHAGIPDDDTAAKKAEDDETESDKDSDDGLETDDAEDDMDHGSSEQQKERKNEKANRSFTGLWTS